MAKWSIYGRTFIDAFWARTRTNKETECVEWTGYRTPSGYGQMRLRGQLLFAHRFAIEWSMGREVPTGMHVLHHCDNPPCVNPMHLFIGSNYDNIKDSIAKGRFQHGSRHYMAKLTEADVIRIRRMLADGMSPRQIAASFSVSRGSIDQIRRGRSWKHVQ